MPARLRHFRVDLVHNRVFILAYVAYVHYSAIAETGDQHAAATGLPDPIDIPPPSIEEIGKGVMQNFGTPSILFLLIVSFRI